MGVLYAKVNGSWEAIPGAATTAIDIQQVWPAGSIRVTISGSADIGWLLFGQTVTNAQTIYPALWLVAPATWKSGANLVIPSDVDCGLRGSSVAGLGQISGTNTKTIATANLPAHAHGVNITSGNDSPDHTHLGVDHLHGVSIQSGGQNQSHYHMGSGNRSLFVGSGSNYIYANAGAGTVDYVGTDWASHDHSHAVNGSTGAADRGLTTGGASVRHTHAVNGTSDNAGSGTALNVQEAAINVRFQIKAH